MSRRPFRAEVCTRSEFQVAVGDFDWQKEIRKLTHGPAHSSACIKIPGTGQSEPKYQIIPGGFVCGTWATSLSLGRKSVYIWLNFLYSLFALSMIYVDLLIYF